MKKIWLFFQTVGEHREMKEWNGIRKRMENYYRVGYIGNTKLKEIGGVSYFRELRVMCWIMQLCLLYIIFVCGLLQSMCCADDVIVCYFMNTK